MADFDAILRKLEFSGSIDPAEFLEKLLIPTGDGQPDPLEDLRLGFRKRIVEPCFNQISLLYKSLETDAQKPVTKERLSRLLNPIKEKDLNKISDEYQKKLNSILGTGLNSLSDGLVIDPQKTKKVKDLMTDPFNLLVLVEKYQDQAAKILEDKLKLLESTSDLGPKTSQIPQTSAGSPVESAVSQTNKKDIESPAKNPDIKLVAATTKDGNKSVMALPIIEAGLFGGQAKEYSDNWSIAKPRPKQIEQASLEPEEIIVTLSDKSLTDLKGLLKKIQMAPLPKTAAQNSSNDMSESELGFDPLDAAIGLLTSKAVLVAGAIAAVTAGGTALGLYLNKLADDAWGINKKFADWYNKDREEHLDLVVGKYKAKSDEAFAQQHANILKEGMDFKGEKLDSEILKTHNEYLTAQQRARSLEKLSEIKRPGIGGSLKETSDTENVLANNTHIQTAQKKRNELMSFREYIKVNPNTTYNEFDTQWSSNGAFQKEQLKNLHESKQIQNLTTQHPLIPVKEQTIRSILPKIDTKKTAPGVRLFDSSDIPKNPQTDGASNNFQPTLENINRTLNLINENIRNQNSSGDTVNNIVTNNSSSSEDSTPIGLVSGRDPIYDFRSNWIRSTASNTYT